MKKIILKVTILVCIVTLIIGYIPIAYAANSSKFILTPDEQSYLDTLRTRPVSIAYSYDLVAANFGEKSYSMLDPILGLLQNEFGLTVNLLKLDWHNSFLNIENGSVDFYGPIAISDNRRQKYVTVEPFYQNHSKIVTRVSEPINSMLGLYNRSIGLLEGSVISRTMQTYLGPDGKSVYFQTMDDMIMGLENGEIDAFATVDNAEFEILRNDDIHFEFSIDNFFVDQGFISGKDELRPLADLINRYITENPEISDKVTNLRNEALIQYTKERFAREIEYVQTNYDKVPMYSRTTLFPLCYEENGIIKGMQIEINEVFEKLTGVPIEFSSKEEFPDETTSALEKLRNGECMAIVGGYYVLDVWNDPSFQYSPLLWQNTLRIYSSYGGSDSLSGKSIGTLNFITDYLGWNNTTGNPPVIFKNQETLLDALENNEVDAVFMGEMMFNYEYSILKDYSLREITGLSAEAAMHMIYSPQNAEFNALFNEAMRLYHILEPQAMEEWKSESDKYKSDYMRIRHMQQMWITVVAVVFIVMVSALIFMMMKNLRQNKKTIELMKILNEKDVLTGIYNRRYMDTNLDKTIKLLARPHEPLTVFMIDIDFFKLYNDTYGHGQGDECLKSVANALKVGLRREDDFVARYGGEEFAVVLPHTNERGAKIVAEKLLNSVRDLKIPHEKNKASDCVSISIGVTTGTVDHLQTGLDYLNRADKALYISKSDGRNKYTFLEFEKEKQ